MNRLVVSFSGGRTSGYMTRRVLETWRDRYDEIVVLFANTGQEHEETLNFVRKCDYHFKFETVWLEASISQQHGAGTTHKVVTYETASRNGYPFEQLIKKYGLPGPNKPICTRELKLQAMRSYLRDALGWKSKSYEQVIGIRADEIDRMSPSATERNIKYPLVGWGVTKAHVTDWWAGQKFNLDIQEHQGNCIWCFKKSDRKLFTLAKENPEWFDFPMRMEKEYAMVGAMARKYGKQSFYRNYRGASDIIASSKKTFIPWTPATAQQQIGLFTLDEMDYTNGCSESCEVEYI